MDLVSSTLDKYLKHRFNGNGLNKTVMITTNGINTDHTDTPAICKIFIKKIKPCCVSLREDLKFLAAGFENSQIYLWSLKQNQNDNQEEKSIDEISINDMFRLLAHTGPVYNIQFLKDLDLMLSCSEDTTIRLWCLNEKCNVFVYRGHNYPVWSLDIGPQGSLFASASMDTTARMFRLDKMTPLRIFCGHDDDVECVKFHPNEKYIATGSSDTTIRLWSISDGKMVRLMVGHQKPIISLSFLPNGKFLASVSGDGIIKIWNLATNSVSNEFHNIPSSFTISFSAEQKFISSCGIDNVLRLYQLEQEQSKLIEKESLNFQAQETNLIQSQFHTNSNKLFVIGYSISDCQKTKKNS